MKLGGFALVLIHLHLQINKSYYLEQKPKKSWEIRFDQDCRNMSGISSQGV